MAAARPIFVWPRDRLDDARFAEDIQFEEVVSTTIASHGPMEWSGLESESSGYSTSGTEKKETETETETETDTVPGTMTTDLSTMEIGKDSGAEGDPSQLFSGGPIDEEEQLIPCTQPPPVPGPDAPSSSESSGSDSDGEIVDETTISAILERARAETRAKEKVETAKVNAEIEARLRANSERELQKGKRGREEQSIVQQTPEQFQKKKIKKTPTPVEETKERRQSGSGKKEKKSDATTEYTAILEAELRKSMNELAALKAKKRSSDGGSSKTGSGSSSKAPLEPQSKSTPKRTSSKHQSSRPSTSSKASPPGPSTSGGAKGSATKRPSSSQSRDTTKEDKKSTKTAAKKASPAPPKERTPTPSKAPRFKIEDVLTKKQLQWGKGRKTGYRRELSFRCPYCPHVVRQRDAMTTHLAASHQGRVGQEPRGMKGAQARVVNASTSGPRVLDEAIYSSVMGGLRGIMSAGAYAKTTTAFKQLLTHVTANVGRADVVNLAPHAEFVAALNSAMADGDLSVPGGRQDDSEPESDGDAEEEQEDEEFSGEEEEDGETDGENPQVEESDEDSQEADD